MTDARQTCDDEIDLVELFAALWEGKWKIFGVASVTVFGSFLFQVVQGPPNFVATTEIGPISSTQAALYSASNAVGVFEVNQQILLSLFEEELSHRSAIEHAVRELRLVRAEDFANNDEFEEAVTEFVAAIEISPSTDSGNTDSSAILTGVTIRTEIHDKRLWRETLTLINFQINSTVRSSLNDSIHNTLRVAQQERDFLLEDLELKEEALLADYYRITSDRLAYLREQAEIARALDVANNTLEVQTFNTQNRAVSANRVGARV